MRNVLEIGSGQGFFTSILSKDKRNKVIGIDISEEDIRISKMRYPAIEFKKMSAERLIFEKNFFHEVYAIEVLEHVDNLERVLNEVKRVIKKKGKVVVSVPYYKSEAWLKKIRPTYFKEIHHVRVFRENEIDEMFSKRGFKIKVKKKKGFLQHFELYFLFKRNVNSKTQLSIGSWRDNYYTKSLHVISLYFDPVVLHTPLKYIPIWIVSLPLGYIMNFFGNKLFPKSLYYEFIKK